MSKFTTEHYTCNHCELATGPVEHDLGDEDETEAVRVPVGWVEVVVRRVVRNPDRDAEIKQRDDFVRQQVAALTAQAQKQGETPSPEDVANFTKITRDQIDMENPIDEPEFVVEEEVAHLCQEHAPLINSLLALDDTEQPS